MRFFRDDPTRVTIVDWYYTGSSTVVPYPSAFCRRVWEYPYENQVPVGEVAYSWKWRTPLPPFSISYGSPCGTAEQWSEGALTTDPVPPVYPGTTTPRCCPPPDVGVYGGVEVGGLQTPFVCSICKFEEPLTLFWSEDPIFFTPCLGQSGMFPLTRFSTVSPIQNCNNICWISGVVTFMGVTCIIALCDPTNAQGTGFQMSILDPVNPFGVPPLFFVNGTIGGGQCTEAIAYGYPISAGPCAGDRVNVLVQGS
jgi:hypothetical protein